MRPASLLALCAFCAACTPFPELDGAVSPEARASGFPELLPLDSLPTGVEEGQITPDLTAGVQARVAALRARAARLQRRPIVEQRVKRNIAAAQARAKARGQQGF